MTRLLRGAFAAALVLSMAAPAVAQENAKAKREPTAGQIAARERQAQCSAEWKQAKAGGTLAKDAKWPQFWSACNTRLKAAKT